MKKLILALMAITFFTGCVTYEKCVTKFAQNMKPDTVTEVRVDTFEITRRDTAITRIKGDSVTLHDTLKIQADCPDGSKAKVKINYQKSGSSGNAALNIKIVDSILEVNCQADSLTQLLITERKTITLLKDSLRTINNQIKFVPPPTNFWKKLPWYAWLMIILVLTIVLTAFIKK